MKLFVFIGLLAASAAANVQLDGNDGPPIQSRNVVGGLTNVFARWSQSIRNAGLDPVNVESKEAGWTLLTPQLFSVRAFIESFNSNGLSRYVTHTLRIPFLSMTMYVDIEIPAVTLTFGNIGAGATLFGVNFNLNANGTVVFSRIRLQGEVHFHNRLFDENYVRSMQLGVNLQAIDSNLSVDFLGGDVSETVNQFISRNFYDFLLSYKPQIDEYTNNELLEIIKVVM